METIQDFLRWFVDVLVGRASGPLNFRLVVMPTVVTLLALRADWKDAREGWPAFLGAFITDPVERRRLFHSGVKGAGRVFLMAVLLDSIYQVIVFRWIYPGQVLVVAIVCAIVPYVLVRGPITRLARLLYRKWAGPAATTSAKSETRED
jgi:hypothetical protein